MDRTQAIVAALTLSHDTLAEIRAGRPVDREANEKLLLEFVGEALALPVPAPGATIEEVRAADRDAFDHVILGFIGMWVGLAQHHDAGCQATGLEHLQTAGVHAALDEDAP